jgi:hypothetical protein
VIQDNDKPLAVLVRYTNFMAMLEGGMKWEYKVVRYETKDPRFINDGLEAEGEDGFELVQVVGKLYYFKRRKA